MRTILKNSFLLPVMLVGFGSMMTSLLRAHTFETLHMFSGSDGAWPSGSLVLSGNTLYGTTRLGGIANTGTVFALKTDGTGFRVLHSFISGRDGAGPRAGLTLSGDTLYGTTFAAGRYGNGTVFKINTDGTGFGSLYYFSSTHNITNRDGAKPSAELILSGDTLYGTTWAGGSAGYGTLFAVSTNGTGFKTLHSFDSKEASPNGLLMLDNRLYGTTYMGGGTAFLTRLGGTVFGVNSDGTAFTNLHPFSSAAGEGPLGSLVLSGKTLYGTTSSGGFPSAGTVFAVGIGSTHFTHLHTFSGGSDGANPQSGLALWDNTLYGTAAWGGRANKGSVFAVETDGTAFTTLHEFTGSDGYRPFGSVVLSGNTLYGTTGFGGTLDQGTVFKIELDIRLSIVPYDGNLILTWPNHPSGSGFSLQSATNLISPVWTPVSPAPVLMNGQHTVINPLSGAQRFYRLSH